jgi:hypothetical protein
MNVELSKIIILFHSIHDVVVNNFNIIINVYVRNIFSLFFYSSKYNCRLHQSFGTAVKFVVWDVVYEIIDMDETDFKVLYF